MEILNYWMVIAYELVSAANEYWFGFILDHKLYVVPHMTFTELAKFFRKDRASSKRGGFQKIRIKANVNELAELLPRAILLGSEDRLTIKKNRGDALEAILLKDFCGMEWAKNDTPFWVAGDMVIDGKQVQVKFNSAELTNENVFRNNFPELLPN